MNLDSSALHDFLLSNDENIHGSESFSLKPDVAEGSMRPGRPF